MAPLSGWRFLALSGWAASLGRVGRSGRLAAVLGRERERWLLWLPVAFGSGIAAYFAVSLEPSPWLGAASTGVLGGLGVLLRRRPAALIGAIGLATVGAGFTAAQIEAWAVAAPVVAAETRPLALTGTVAAVEVLASGQRVMLADLAIPRLEQPMPARLRLRLGQRAEPLRPGQRIATTAVLRPPQPPALPGGFDFARHAWFERLGAVGYAVAPVRILAPAADDGAATSLAALRHAMTRRIAGGIGGGDGAVAAALLTGERAAMPAALLDAYRDSGLAHLLSISGLHMSLLAGLVFLVVRGGLALAPAVALRFPIKKWAAAAALVATAAYMAIAGAPVPTQRAFIGIALVLMAVMLDRSAITMRLVAWAALAVLLWQPHALIGASFQMSFAAVVALVAAYEAVGRRGAAVQARPWWWRPLAYVGGVALSSLVAGSATAVYGLYHFNGFATYSLAANLVAVPLTGFLVMPCLIVAALLMPLSAEGWVLPALGWSVAMVNRTAEVVAAWPGARLMLPSLPAWALVAFTLGGLWLCLWRTRWRLLGLAGLAAVPAGLLLTDPPDLLVDGDGRLIAARAADGRLMLSTLKGERLAREAWLETAGSGLEPLLWPAAGATADGRLSCDSAGCLYRAGGQTVALVRQSAALAEDCATATVVIAGRLSPARSCAALVIDRRHLRRDGAHALWLSPAGIRIETVRQRQGDRPWVQPAPPPMSPRSGQ